MEQETFGELIRKTLSEHWDAVISDELARLQQEREAREKYLKRRNFVYISKEDSKSFTEALDGKIICIDDMPIVGTKESAIFIDEELDPSELCQPDLEQIKRKRAEMMEELDVKMEEIGYGQNEYAEPQPDIIVEKPCEHSWDVCTLRCFRCGMTYREFQNNVAR